MTLLWWAIFFGLNVAVEIGCIAAILRHGRAGIVTVVGAALILVLPPSLSIALMSPMSEIDPNLHGGAGTGIAYALILVVIACVAAHLVIMLLTVGYVASLQAEAERSKKAPPGSGADS
jgi:hypothetical protein